MYQLVDFRTADLIISDMFLPRLYATTGGLVKILIAPGSLRITDQCVRSTNDNLLILGWYLVTIVKGVVLL